MDKATFPPNRENFEELMKRTPLPPSPRLSSHELQACLSKAKSNAQVIDCLLKFASQHGGLSDIGTNFPNLWTSLQEWRKVGVS